MNTYFDNASTSFPKPVAVGVAMCRWLTEQGGTYGRSASERVLQSVAMVEKCRDLLSAMIGSPSNLSENLFFTPNATHAANTVLKGIGLKKGDRVLVSPMEHNAVMRPLEFLGVEYEVLPAFADGSIDTEALFLLDVDDVKLIIINHISNVNGVIQPLEKIGQWCAARRLKLMIDASQSIGAEQIDVEKSNVDYLIFTGHKALLGPMGTGGFWTRDPSSIEPLIHGGTGSNSDSLDMPSHYPDRMEAGTPNVVGIVGLLAAIENRPKTLHSKADLEHLHARISSNTSLKVFGDVGRVFSLASNKLPSSQIARILYERYKIEVRSGLHCSPLAHRHLKTFPAGAVRIAISPYHTAQELEYLATSLSQICI